MSGLTLRDVSTMSGVSSSHLSRIEKGNRFPSARILRRIAKPLGFGEVELLSYAGFLSPQFAPVVEGETQYNLGRLHPYVASVLASEPVGTQRIVIAPLTMLKSFARY